LTTAAITSPLLLSMGIRDREALGWIQAKAPLLLSIGLKPVRDARLEADKRQHARAARVGRDLGVVDRADFGHSLRMVAVRGHDGAVLREPDVEVADEEDREPGTVRRTTVRRGRRADPLLTLYKYKSITEKQFDAAECLRADMEAAMPRLAGGGQSDVHLAPWARGGVSGRQMEACATVREALARIGAQDQLTVAWVLAGGTISGLAAYARVSDMWVSASLRRALDVLVDFYDADEQVTAA
jgi:hypothetical protein